MPAQADRILAVGQHKAEHHLLRSTAVLHNSDLKKAFADRFVMLIDTGKNQAPFFLKLGLDFITGLQLSCVWCSIS